MTNPIHSNHPNRGSSKSLSMQGRSLRSIYLELGKVRLSAMIVMTTIAGFLLAGDQWNWILLAWTVAGTALSSLGANAYNEWWETLRDGRMKRTQNRPLPSGQISSIHAFVYATVISIAGIGILVQWVNLLTAGLALANVAIYVLLYTPLKPHSTLCTLVGAVCGAIPPMMGWTAVTGELQYGAWLLGATLFIWQIPHFLALAWLYRDDYRRGGFRMLPLVDGDGQITCQVILLYSIALVPLGLAYALGGLTGIFFTVGSMLLGMVFFGLGIQLYIDRSLSNARRLFLASIVYLPILLGLMVADRNSSHLTPAFQSTPSAGMMEVTQEPTKQVAMFGADS